MEEVQVVGTAPGTREVKVVGTSLGTPNKMDTPPGYMRSTLRTPGPCARPITAKSRPGSVKSAGSQEVPRCPHCHCPLADNFYRRVYFVPDGAQSGALAYKNMAEYDKIERIAAKFGIRGSSFQPSSRAMAAGYVSTAGSVNSHKVSVPSTQETKLQPRRTRLRQKSATTRGEQDLMKGIQKNRAQLQRTNSYLASEQNKKTHESWDSGKDVPRGRPMRLEPRYLPMCSCASAYMIEGTTVLDPNGMSSPHFMDFTQMPPQVPVYISAKFPIRNPRERKPSLTDTHGGLSSPDGGHKLLHGRHRKVPPINSQSGATYINKAESAQSEKEVSVQPTKTMMDVYLPRLSLAHESDQEDLDLRDMGQRATSSCSSHDSNSSLSRRKPGTRRQYLKTRTKSIDS